MKTLYVSDLDGTLLNSQQQTSTYTNQTIEKLVDQGMLFSYATARSYYSAKPATKGLSAKIPLILYNGAFIIDNQSQEILVSNFFLKEEVNDLTQYFNQKNFYHTGDQNHDRYSQAKCRPRPAEPARKLHPRNGT